ncbi:MAG: hypothetical protein B6241_04825 [Spirochaetaceae bacterium 4572_59]|nr:MAG: hypothetical protein B6241_04825 [Spirochaetaceae bacterium 4572_59]
MVHKRNLLILNYLILLSLSAYSKSQPRHILYLSSYDSRMSWSGDILRGLEDLLDPEHNNILLHVEYMDTKEFNSEPYLRAFGELLELKYRDTPVSLLLCSDNNAFEFLRANHKRLYPSIPVVFCGINDFKKDMIAEHPEFTGVTEVIPAADTIEFALKMHPDTREVYIINDYLTTGLGWQSEMKNQLSYLENRVKLSYSENLSMEELRRKIASFQKETIILLGAFYSDRDGQSFTYESSGELLSRASEVPFYCLLDFNIRAGSLGGKVLSGYSQGEAMAGIAKRLLDGESPRNIPVIVEGVNSFVFNYPQLERFGISESQLPENSILINRPYSVYEEYKREIGLFLSLFLILIIAVIALVINILRKNQVETTLRELVEASWEGIVIHDRGTVIQCNNMFLSMFGYSSDEIMGKNILSWIFTPESLPEVRKRIETEDIASYGSTGIRKDGTVFPLEIRLRIVQYRGETVRVSVIRDLTEQKKMEERLSQSQKMQAIGTLAGGIAHDFNNILSAVIGYADLGLLSVNADSQLYSYFNQILMAGTRARDLTRQILTFSRQSGKEKISTNLGSLIKETMALMKATLPSTIQINLDLNPDIFVMADSVQLQQVIMNLCTNAGLAMRENGGILKMVLKKVQLDEESFPSGQKLPAGSYARLIVSDTGCGMPEVVRSRIFEPFYTTRKHGEGTGMGLSVVHGIIMDLSGGISVYSSEGEGSVFTIFLPVCYRSPQQEEKPGHIEGGSERILFVDDELYQVNLATDLLGALGYRVVTTVSSRDALEIFRAAPEDFDLLISDLTMPEMTGDDLVRQVHHIRPEMPVLMCSGYSERISREKLEKIGISHVMMKPLRLQELAVSVRDVLGS